MFRYRGILNSDRLIFTSVEGVSEILQRHYEFIQPEQVKMFAEPAIGPGLVLVNGEEHKKQRRELMPSFSMRHIRELHPVFWGKAVEMTRKFEQLIAEAGTASGFSAPILIDHWVGLGASSSPRPSGPSSASSSSSSPPASSRASPCRRARTPWPP